MIDISVPIRSSRWIRNRDGERSVGIRLLHGKVAAPSSDLDETVGGQDAAGFTVGQDAKPNQPQPRSSLRDFASQTPIDLAGRCGLEAQGKGFGEIVAGLGHGLALARNVQIGAERHIAIAAARPDARP